MLYKYSADPGSESDPPACIGTDGGRSHCDRRRSLYLQSGAVGRLFDIFYIGEGETVYDELLDAYKVWKNSGKSRKEFLETSGTDRRPLCARLYDPEYNTDGTLKSFTPNNMHAPDTVKKQVVMDVTDTSYPMKPVVPFITATQDRVVLEIQAGMYPRLPFLPGRNDIPSYKRAECG